MNNKPIEIKRLGSDGMAITWADNSKQEISSLTLRKNCPCASCRQTRGDTSHEKPLGTAKKSALRIVQSSVEEETKLEKIWPVGSYAIGVEWADGHNTGIYTYEFLHELGKCNK